MTRADPVWGRTHCVRSYSGFAAGPDVVRFLPPLIIEKNRIDEVIDVFDEILRQGLA